MVVWKQQDPLISKLPYGCTFILYRMYCNYIVFAYYIEIYIYVILFSVYIIHTFVAVIFYYLLNIYMK